MSIVEQTRLWLGTPYRHQASCLGAGCDCLGLLRGVWRARYGAEPCAIPAYSRDWSEPSGDEVLWRKARVHLIEKPFEHAAPGDVLLFRMRDRSVAKHLGILSAPSAFIHAYSGRGVVESPLSRPWARRVVAAFAFPDVI